METSTLFLAIRYFRNSEKISNSARAKDILAQLNLVEHQSIQYLAKPLASILELDGLENHCIHFLSLLNILYPEAGYCKKDVFLISVYTQAS